MRASGSGIPFCWRGCAVDGKMNAGNPAAAVIANQQELRSPHEDGARAAAGLTGNATFHNRSAALRTQVEAVYIKQCAVPSWAILVMHLQAP